jgi:hypothetical protein
LLPNILPYFNILSKWQASLTTHITLIFFSSSSWKLLHCDHSFTYLHGFSTTKS